jgi:hypothetical protein
MSVAVPLFFLGGAALAAAVAALHFLARREPKPRPFPTARFVPERPARAPAVARRPSDLVLMALRVAAVVLLVVAFARPTLETRRPLGRVVLAAGDFELPPAVTAGADTVVRSAGLSAGLVRALRAAAAVAPGVDSLELVIVSPFTEAHADAATLGIRAEWNGRAEVVRVAASEPSVPAVEATLGPDDPLAAAIALAGLAGERGTVRVRRVPPSAADSAWAGAGAALVYWPADLTATGWLTGDTTGAVTAGHATVVHAFRRATPPGGRAVAWWADGTAAAAEHTLGTGCVREVGIDLAAGDLALRETTRRVVAALLAPCGDRGSAGPLSDSVVAALAGAGPLRDARGVPGRMPARVPAQIALLVGAAIVLVAEQTLRRRVKPS